MMVLASIGPKAHTDAAEMIDLAAKYFRDTHAVGDEPAVDNRLFWPSSMPPPAAQISDLVVSGDASSQADVVTLTLCNLKLHSRPGSGSLVAEEAARDELSATNPERHLAPERRGRTPLRRALLGKQAGG